MTFIKTNNNFIKILKKNIKKLKLYEKLKFLKNDQNLKTKIFLNLSLM